MNDFIDEEDPVEMVHATLALLFVLGQKNDGELFKETAHIAGSILFLARQVGLDVNLMGGWDVIDRLQKERDGEGT